MTEHVGWSSIFYVNVPIGLLAIAASYLLGAMAPATAAGLSDVGVDRAGVGSAVLNSSRQLGGSIGIALMGAIMAHDIGGRSTPTALSKGSRRRSRSVPRSPSAVRSPPLRWCARTSTAALPARTPPGSPGLRTRALVGPSVER